MRNLIFLLLLPAVSFTQKVNEFWVTPIANIEFTDTKIIYSYSIDECITFGRIEPVHYNPAILEMQGVIGTGCIDDYNDMFQQLYTYLDEWYYGKACNKDKYNYLKAASLLIIWNVNGKDFLPPNTPEFLGYLENDMAIEISQATKQVLKLYEFYNPNAAWK